MKLYSLQDSDGWRSIQLIKTEDTAVSAAEALCEATRLSAFYYVDVICINVENMTMIPVKRIYPSKKSTEG